MASKIICAGKYTLTHPDIKRYSSCFEEVTLLNL